MRKPGDNGMFAVPMTVEVDFRAMTVSCLKRKEKKFLKVRARCPGGRRRPGLAPVRAPRGA
jgi:hypothetical protein